MSRLLFVYGTLKRGCSNHAQLVGQAFLGAARTVPGYRLYDLGGYPGLSLHASDTTGVTGEVWSVDDAALRRLDQFEGVHAGLYRRELIPLQPPFEDQQVEAYFPVLTAHLGREIGSEWIE